MNSKSKTTFKELPVPNAEFWGNTLKRYKTAKVIRKLRDNLDLSKLSELTGFSRQYIYGIQEMTIKPSQDFLKKLDQLKK